MSIRLAVCHQQIAFRRKRVERWPYSRTLLGDVEDKRKDFGRHAQFGYMHVDLPFISRAVWNDRHAYETFRPHGKASETQLHFNLIPSITSFQIIA